MMDASLNSQLTDAGGRFHQVNLRHFAEMIDELLETQHDITFCRLPFLRSGFNRGTR